MAKKKVLLLGATGMLGSAVYDVLQHDYDLVLTARTPEKIQLLEKAYGGTSAHTVVAFDAAPIYQDYLAKKGAPGAYLQSFVDSVGLVDYVINAIGITIPFSLENEALTFFINSALPHLLANIYGEKLIHITTDCAYNGKDGFPYDEKSLKTPVDVYGLSKSLGEPMHCLTLRTSIIGRELEGFTGLLEWFLQQRGKTLTGFSSHFWNGITTKEFGKVCHRIMQNPEQFPRTGLYHIFSNTVSKYKMLLKFEEKYKIGVTVNADAENKLNRTLATIYPLNAALEIPSFDQMVNEL